MKLTVNLGGNSYPIYIENGILADAGSYISRIFTGKQIMVISDDHVFPLYGQQLLDSLKDYECHSLVLPHGEPTKSFETLPRIYAALLDARLTRSDLATWQASPQQAISAESGWYRSPHPCSPR